MTAPGETKSLTGRICFPIPGLTPPGRPTFKASAEDQAASAGDGMSDGQSAIRLADRHYASRMTTNGGERDRPGLATFLWPIVSGLLIMAVLIRFVVFADGQPPWYIWPGIAAVVYGIARTTARALKKARRQA